MCGAHKSMCPIMSGKGCSCNSWGIEYLIIKSHEMGPKKGEDSEAKKIIHEPGIWGLVDFDADDYFFIQS
jgi:hypothetical protein